eukprot:5367333-Pyramimonas_sp.AAC.2
MAVTKNSFRTFCCLPGAFDAATEDVTKAFKYYLKTYNDGRPFVIAGHSQGSQHAALLINYIETHVEEFPPDLLKNQLVCAYLPGYMIGKGVTDVLPTCYRHVTDVSLVPHRTPSSRCRTAPALRTHAAGE